MAVEDWMNQDTRNQWNKLPIKKKCETYDEIQKTIESKLIDHSCQIPYLSSIQICEILNSYSKIIWIGDSISRHQLQGLLILLTEDFRYGGLLHHQSLDLYNQCGCDGQFAEALVCRKALFPDYMGPYKNDQIHFQDLRQWGLCSSYVPNQNQETNDSEIKNLRKKDRRTLSSHKLMSTHRKSIENNVYTVNSSLMNRRTTEKIEKDKYYEAIEFMFESYTELQSKNYLVTECPKKKLPTFLYVQVGHHCNAYDCQKIIKNIMNTIVNSYENCLDQLRIVFTHIISSTPELIHLFPNQSNEKVIRNNRILSEYVQTHFPSVVILNFYNLSIDMIDHTSDGLHRLTDMNIIRAIEVINMMNSMIHMKINQTALNITKYNAKMVDRRFI